METQHIYIWKKIKKKKFKSYYVVWKLRAARVVGCPILCLNRTMQYGNKVNRIPLCFENAQFKSYYVVWKLKNNKMVLPLFFVFKSYYVVWKLYIWKRIKKKK